MRLANRAEEHRVAGAKYGAIRREIEEILTYKSMTGNISLDNISEIRATLDRLATEVPATPH